MKKSAIIGLMLFLLLVGIAHAGGSGVTRDYVPGDENGDGVIKLHAGSSTEYGFRFPNTDYEYTNAVNYELISEIANVIHPEGFNSTGTLELPPRTTNTELVVLIQVPPKASVGDQFGVAMKSSSAGPVGNQKTKGTAISMGTSASTHFTVEVVDPETPETKIDRNVHYAKLTDQKPKNPLPLPLVGIGIGSTCGLAGGGYYLSQRKKKKLNYSNV